MNNEVEKIDIDFISQYEVSDEGWQSRSCAVACLTMIFRFFGDSIKIDEILREGDLMGGNNSQGDWTHEHLVMLARNHGFNAYRQEFKSFDLEKGEYIRKEEFFKEGLKHLQKAIVDGFPILVSARKDLDEKSSNHMVLITGFKKKEYIEGFYLLDPKEKEDGEVFLNLEEFQRTWRKMAIFIYPFVKLSKMK